MLFGSRRDKIHLNILIKINMQTISKYFVAFLLTVLSSLFGDKEAEEKEKETVLREKVKTSCTLTEVTEEATAVLLIS